MRSRKTIAEMASKPCRVTNGGNVDDGKGQWCRSSKAYHWELKKKEMETQEEIPKGRSEKQDFLKG